MGSYKNQNKLNIFLLQEGKTRAQLYSNQSKTPKSRSVRCLRLTIFWVLKGLSYAHMVHFTGSGWLHSTAAVVLDGRIYGTDISKLLGSLLELDFTYVLSWTLTAPSLSCSPWLPVWSIHLAMAGPQLLCASTDETLPRRHCLNDTGLFLSQQSKFHFDGSCLSLNMPDSSVSAGQNHWFSLLFILLYVNECLWMYVLV